MEAIDEQLTFFYPYLISSLSKALISEAIF